MRKSILMLVVVASVAALGVMAAQQAAAPAPGFTRTVLHLHPRLAPITVAVFPLKKNEPRLVELARGVKKDLQAAGLRAVYDDTGAIGKLYRRQDEIGTPFCITVDFQSLEDKTVTVRDRDTMTQERVGTGELGTALRAKVG